MQKLYLSVICVFLIGCGSGAGAGCTPTGFSFNAQPANQAAPIPDHTAKAPGNQIQFAATAGAISGPGCPTPQFVAIVPAIWTTSQPNAVQISSAKDATNGLVTCTGATTGAATLTASYTQGKFTETATTTVTCK